MIRNSHLVGVPRPSGDDQRCRAEHLALLPKNQVEVPFYLWYGHYMFARNGFGEHADLNFFIDTGLVYLAPDSSGRVRQACFLTTPALYEKWGAHSAHAARQHFESPLAVSLGPLKQTDQFFATVASPSWASFGGVRIDGLLSHAFLSRYAWTLDFARQQYVFGIP